MKISVLICTHNPRPDYLDQALAALRLQTLSLSTWELIIIDNASMSPITSLIDLHWQPNARILAEPKLGLTPARLRAIREASADLLVFVDDDNVLAPNFLAEAVQLAANRPYLGAFGCSIHAVYEKEPVGVASEWIWLLTVGEIQYARWSNLGVAGSEVYTLPSGAGLVIRKNVAEAYARLATTDQLRASLDRRGTNLTGSGDRDLSATSIQLGLGTGKFPNLKLDHLIPAERVESDYLIRLAEATAYGETILYFLHGLSWNPLPLSRTRRWLQTWEHWHLSSLGRELHSAQARGRARAVTQIKSLPSEQRAASRPLV